MISTHGSKPPTTDWCKEEWKNIQHEKLCIIIVMHNKREFIRKLIDFCWILLICIISSNITSNTFSKLFYIIFQTILYIVIQPSLLLASLNTSKFASHSKSDIYDQWFFFCHVQFCLAPLLIVSGLHIPEEKCK